MEFTTLITDVNVSSVLVFFAVLLLLYLSTRKPAGIPPGPLLTLPFVGDIPVLIGGDILGTFRQLRRKHGDIFSLYLGKDLTIIINSYRLIHEAAVAKGALFTARPDVLMNEASGGRQGLVFNDGLFWKSQRKFVHGSLQEFGFGKTSFEDKILREVECFIELIRNENGHPLDMRESLHACVANVVFSIVCGKRHDYEDKSFQSFLRYADLAANQILKVSVLLSCAPFLAYVPGDPLKMKVMKHENIVWKEYFRKMYEEHAKTIDINSPRDLYDVYIAEKLKQDNADFTVDQIGYTARDLFAAGTETTATTIRWALLYLLKYEDVKMKLQSNIDSTISDGELPCLADKSKLPYVEAFIMEVLRCADTAPLAVPHSVSENDVVFEGYRIPKGTAVIFNIDSVLKDPLIFENPFEFDPGRFIDNEGNIKRIKEFIPFGIGRRVCLGEAVAKMELFLFLTAMIKYFDFSLPEDIPEPDLVGVLGITHAPKPFKVRAIRRHFKSGDQ